MKFLRNLLAAILGCLIAFGICFFMFLIFASLLNTQESVTVKKNSVLELRLPYQVNDYTGNSGEDPFAALFEQSQGLDEILHAIRVAKDDDRIQGISINSNFLMAGISQTQAIRKALEDFKSDGKFVYAYGDIFVQKDYYLASVSDSIFINPVGMMEFKGLAAEVLYLKELQEKTGVKMEVVRHGKYKSAVEPYLADEMSDANREQIRELIVSVWNTMLEDISTSRNISVAALNGIADTLGARNPEYAKSVGLIDDIYYADQYEMVLKEATNTDEDKSPNYISLTDYVKVAKKKKLYKGKDKIAVIFAQGEIFYGEGGPNIIGQGVMNKAIKKAREDEKVKAIVLRVNSPGGSALTSDMIWRELELAKEKKPLVVSMGDVAASGGYYIAVGADKIYAEPSTITGSIGVFGTIPNISELADDIGVNAEQVGTNVNAVDYSLFEPMTENFRNVIEEGIEATYTTFLSRVAEGRNISMSEADSLAQGRVWSGVDAQRLGLVDELGGLQDAVEAAATMAEISEYSIRKYPRYKSGFERFMEDFEGTSAEAQEALIKEEIGDEFYSVLKELQGVLKQKGIQARMPFTLNIK